MGISLNHLIDETIDDEAINGAATTVINPSTYKLQDASSTYCTVFFRWLSSDYNLVSNDQKVLDYMPIALSITATWSINC
jgi:hypothetical protein